MRTLLRAAALSAVVLVLSTTDASAGPLKRLRDRIKGGSCATASCSAAPATVSAPQFQTVSQPVTVSAPASGCPNGQCPAPSAAQFRRTIFAK
jgi:hypothetical protein